MARLPSQWHAMSGQLSQTMRNQAIAGLIIALLGVMVYISVRFEWRYGVSAVAALVHDVVITLGILAFLHGSRVYLWSSIFPRWVRS